MTHTPISCRAKYDGADTLATRSASSIVPEPEPAPDEEMAGRMVTDKRAGRGKTTGARVVFLPLKGSLFPDRQASDAAMARQGYRRKVG